MKKALLTSMVAAAICVLGDTTPADACGGCFIQPSQIERTVVTDHRMALSVSPTQTVLWDQIRYSGDPSEFAWVLPVRPGAVLELSNNAFFTALDASSQPVVVPPATYGGAMGCGLAGCGTQEGNASAGAPGAGQVQILSQSVIGPYETVTLRATDPTALRDWLTSHAYDIPAAIGPTIDAYVAESFDFIALRLRPQCGERAMQPVRIVTQGADPTLPLRMVAAGVGAQVGLTLYVISEGSYVPSSFPSGSIDPSAIRWDRVNDRSNYEELTTALMGQASGRTWAVQYVDTPQLFTLTDPRYGGSTAPSYVTTGSAGTQTPGLADAYFSQCSAPGARTPSVSTSASSSSSSSSSGNVDPTPCPDTTDAGQEEDAADASEADTGGDDGGEDATAPTPPEPTPPLTKAVCAYLDDLDVAMRGLHPKDVRVTRLRANLPVAALADDLRLAPAAQQRDVQNVYYATMYTDEDTSTGGPQACLSAPKRRTAFGSWVLAIGSALALVSILRRRSRPG